MKKAKYLVIIAALGSFSSPVCAVGMGLWGGLKIHRYLNTDANPCNNQQNGGRPFCERINTMAGFDFWLFKLGKFYLGPGVAYVPFVEGSQSVDGVTTSMNQAYLPVLAQARINLNQWLLGAGMGYAFEIESPASLEASGSSTQVARGLPQNAMLLQMLLGYSIQIEVTNLDFFIRAYYLLGPSASDSNLSRKTASILVINPGIGATFLFE